MSMKARKEIIVTREEVAMIDSFLEICERHDIEYYDRLDFLEAIANEEREFYGIDIIIRG